MVLILAGCGGEGSTNWQQVQGNGFSYNAPADWTVDGAAATNGNVDRVEVRVFRLQRPYERVRRAAVARELDRVVSDIASQQNASVGSTRSLQVDGLDGRSYALDFGGMTEEITFVLDDRREYQLLCRRAAGANDVPCAELLRSFRLG